MVHSEVLDQKLQTFMLPQKHDISIVLVTTDFQMDRIEKVLKQIQNHSLKIELVIINNSATEVTGFGLSGTRIIHNPTKNYGLAACRNYGALFATGAFLLFLDDDSTCYLSEVPKLEENIVFFGPRVDLNQLSPVKSEKYFSKFWRSSLSSANEAAMLGLIAENNMLICRKLFLQVGGFVTLFPLYGMVGQEFLWRLTSKNIPIELDKAITVFQDTNIDREFKIKKYAKIIQRILSRVLYPYLTSPKFQTDDYRMTLQLDYLKSNTYPKILYQSFKIWILRKWS